MPGPKCKAKRSRNAQLAAARLCRGKDGPCSDGVLDRSDGVSVRKKRKNDCVHAGASRETMGASDRMGEGEQQNWSIVHMFQLTRLLCETLCPECLETGLSVTILPDQNACFSSKLRLCCDACGYEKEEMSSPRVQDSDQKNVAFEINSKMVLLSHEVGDSHAVLQKFAAETGMPAMHPKTFQSH